MATRVLALQSHLTSSLSAQQPNPNPYLVGNFAPVSNEGYYGELQVLSGSVPEWLSGQFLRIGPNPKFPPRSSEPYHAFDGDGFVHAIAFSGSKAKLTKRWVRTRRLAAAEARGFDVAEIGMMAEGDYSYAEFTVADGRRMGKANTNVVAHAGRVLALEEVDLPVEIVLSNDGESNLRTVGLFDFNGALTHNMTAHPKVDPVTGELVFFSYEVTQPRCFYSVADKNGVLVRSFEIPTPCGSMMHDMVIAGEYSLLFDQRLEFQLERIGEGKNPWVHRLDLPARFGVLPRLATSADAIKWVDVKPCSLFHFANGWVEPDGIIVVVGSRGGWFPLAGSTNNFSRAYADFQPHQEVVNRPSDPDAFGRLHEWRIDPRGSGRCVSERRLFDAPCDFVQIDHSREGLPTRFVYATRFITDKQKLPKQYLKSLFVVDALCKFDLKTGTSVEMPLVTASGAPGFGGEAVFAPNPARSPLEEDNGVLLVYVHDEQAGKTECQIIDAHTMRVVARLAMPERVPYGFHSCWMDHKHVR